MFEKNSYFDLAIIGAGPAGLFAGISCSNPDFKVLILEKNESPAKKLLLTGSGRCNITHTGTIDDFLKKYGLNSLFLKPVFQNFFNQNLIDFFKSSGLNIIYDAEGRCFPVTFKAGDVLNILLKESRKKNIEIKYNSEVIKSEEADITGFKKSRKTNLSSAENKGFKIISKDGTGFYSEYLLIAAGGASYCNEAAENRGGYVLARNFGHTIKNPESGLARILLFDNEINCLPGTSFSNVEISLYKNNKKYAYTAGEMIITHNGLSGPAVLNLSRYAAHNDILSISFIKREDGLEKKYLSSFIHNHSAEPIKKTLKNFNLTNKFIDFLLEISKISGNPICGNIGKTNKNLLINNLTGYNVKIKGKAKLNEAMVTVGGVSIKEINNKTMESKIKKKLYFAGEIMDIDGDTGGYNLQAAFSTGFLAGTSILKNCANTL